MSRHVLSLVGILAGLLAVAGCAGPAGKRTVTTQPKDDLRRVEEAEAGARRFLDRLEPEQLGELADQSGAERFADSKEQVAAILGKLKQDPTLEVSLTIKGERHRPMEINKPGTYFLGDLARKIAPRGARRIEWSHRDWPFDVHLDLARPCGDLTASISLHLTEPLVLGENVLLVTDVYSLTCDGGLQLANGAQLIGLHPCGLKLNTTTLTSSGSVVPVIATNLRLNSETDITEVATPVPGYAELLSRVTSDAVPAGLSRDGTAGMTAPPPIPPTVKGAMGDPASCAPFTTFVPADDGHPAPAAADGQTGGPGKAGYSPAPLIVTINDLSGEVRFDTSAGAGGTGGDGAAGQWSEGGNGGDIDQGCRPWFWWDAERRPGNGFDGGTGGRGGDGGLGGDGGDGGQIKLKVRQALTRGASFVAITRGGRAGAGGKRGAGGQSAGGDAGRWLPTSGDQTPLGRSGAPGQAGAEGRNGADGRCGRNGRILVNGQVVVPGGDCSERPRDFTYPPPPIEPPSFREPR